MSSVNYVDIGLNSVEEYWDHVVVPSVKVFHDKPSPGSAFGAALSLWHVCDWVWHELNPGQQGRGKKFKRFRSRFVKACPELGWLGDIADTGKHRGLDHPTTVQDAKRGLLPRSGMTVGGRGGFNEIVTLTIDDGSKPDFGGALQKAVVFWCKELAAKKLSAP
jgi:hypothetical protein